MHIESPGQRRRAADLWIGDHKWRVRPDHIIADDDDVVLRTAALGNDGLDGRAGIRARGILDIDTARHLGVATHDLIACFNLRARLVSINVHGRDLDPFGRGLKRQIVGLGDIL